MYTAKKCLFCGYDSELIEQGQKYYFRCYCTGIGDNDYKYCIDYDLYDDLRDDITISRIYNFHHISGFIHESIFNNNKIALTKENLDYIMNSPLIPRTIGNKVNKLILYLYRRTEALGDRVRLRSISTSFNLTYSSNETEFVRILDYITAKGYITRESSNDLILSFEGIEFAQELEQQRQKSTQCFIAMSFNEDLLSQFKEKVMPKIQATGFSPITVDMVHHNDDIADRIIYEIKNSHFVIADFTEQKKGVYYEAGYAKGLGLEVIWTVKEEDVTSLHFDTNHLNHITWKTPEELGQKLQDRILATIPGAFLRKNW